MSEKSKLQVAVLGDSAMWGQGLLEKDKFAVKSVQKIGTLLGRQAQIMINSARSGAAILAGRTPQEARDNRVDFVDTFPHLFGADETVKARFIDGVQGDSQDVALDLHHENPASFPTVEKQVQRVPEAVGQDTELVLLNGGANDLAFDEFLNPEKNRDDFVKHYDSLLEEITFGRVRSLLRQTRDKFPKAVIVYTGYFAPFAPGISNAEMKELFEHMSKEEAWRIWFNDQITIKDVDQLVIEAQWRAQFGVTRGLHWTRKAIAEANVEPAFRAPGILFIHPQFGAENTVFASNSFFHREYEISKVNDAAEGDRVANCPRIQHADEMEDLVKVLVTHSLSDPTSFDAAIRIAMMKSLAQSLLKKLDGPTTLLRVLSRFAQAPLDLDGSVLAALTRDLARINRVRIASFVHPNEKGAQRYTDVIVKRYTELHQRIRLRDNLGKLQKAGGSNVAIGLRESLRRYGLGSATSVRTMTQLMLVDSIGLEVVTAANSEAGMFDDIFLNLGGGNRWPLNFPYRLRFPGIPDKRILDPQQFEPGKTDLFTIDASGVHLGNITQFTLESQATQFSKGEWRPSKITLYLNGVEVFSVSSPGSLTQNGKLTFPYPR